MNRGRVYLWSPDPSAPAGGRIRAGVVPLGQLDSDDPDATRLAGRCVRVMNAGFVETVGLGNAQPDEEGDYLFDPAFGGPRVDRGPLSPAMKEGYIQAARFGEVNAYYHLNRIAAYVNELLSELGEASLPRVTAVVNAHCSAVNADGARDGVRYNGGWRPFQGGHYRLPGPRMSLREPGPLSPDGEIHLGPGWELLNHGALVETAGGPYRHNTSHNAGTLYHEYGHHIARHTADFQANGLRSADMQDNRKTALEEGMCDYWAAALLESPHIWAWHRRHDGQTVHRRSLTSETTLADFDPDPEANPHRNGTIWATALWNFRTRMHDPRKADLLVLDTLVQWGRMQPADAAALRDGVESLQAAMALLLQADHLRFRSAHRELCLDVLGRRGILPLDDAGDLLRGRRAAEGR